MAFLYRISPGEMPTSSARRSMRLSSANSLWQTPKPRNAPAGGLLVYQPKPRMSVFW